MTETPSTPPGWYPDPHAVNTQRYWDGKAWTDKMAPLASPRKPPRKQLLPTWVTVVGLTLCGVFLLWFWVNNSAENDSREMCLQIEEDYPPADGVSTC